jgi:gliding motility-associated-like protein
MGILIEEYRDGVLIGSIVRDMQIRMVDNCPQNPGNDFDIDQDGIFDEDTIVLCADNPVQLDVYLNSTIPGRIYGMNVDNLQDFAGSSFYTTPDPNEVGVVIGHFIWTPTAADIGTQQTVIFTAYDDNCPVVGYANFTYQFTITGLELDVGIDTVAISCTDSVQMVASANNGTPPYSYLWENGTTNPARWVTAGSFWVTVIDAEGCTGSDTISVYYIDDPVAQFTIENGCVDSNITLNDQSYSNFPAGFPPISIIDWDWDYGDGTQANGIQNPTHAFAATGTYTVELIATNDLGCKDTTTMGLIVNPSPEPQFAGPSVCEGLYMNLIDQSTISSGLINAWNWDFGEPPATSSDQNPSHQYATWGYFDVTLTAISDSGCTVSINNSVYVAPYPNADFTPMDVCLNIETQYEDQSTIPAGNVTGWVWDFDENGNTSNIQNPINTYTDFGIYNVELIAYSDSGCTDTLVLPVTVHPLPVAEFTFDTACAELTTSFSDASSLATGLIVSWNWDFGDGVISLSQNPTHAYASGGTYDVSLVVESEYGCQASISHNVLVHHKPVADFTDQNSCLNLSNEFIDASIVEAPGVIDQWSWDFGNGDLSSDPDPSYIYPNVGIYMVQLIVETIDGCRDTMNHQTEVYVLPQAIFNYSNVCLNELPFFENQSFITQGSIDTYEWDFGVLGMTSTLQQPIGIEYSDSGHYDVELIVTSQLGCADTLLETIEIYPLPIASFTFENGCWPNPIQFEDASFENGSYAINDWKWDFGDGQISSMQSPANTYINWGSYDVSLIVTNSAGCSDDTLISNVTLHPKPVADFPMDIGFCQEDIGYFEDQSTLENQPVDTLISWFWNFADGDIAIAQDTTHHYGQAGFYPVLLSVETNHGCVDTVIRSVEVYPHPVVELGADTTEGCQPFLVQFEDLSTIDSGYMIGSWNWDFGDGTQGVTASDPSNLFESDTLGPFDVQTYTVSLEVASIEGCADRDTVTDLISIHPQPEAFFSATPNPGDVINSYVEFTDRSTDNVTSWQWELEGIGVFSTEQNSSYAFEDSGTYWVTEFVSTAFGCMDTVSTDIRVNPYFTFYIPNTITPNDDGVNETFFGSGTYILDYQMFIYNRWGDLIFEAYEEEDHWDGSFRGKASQQGIYVYKFKLVDINLMPHEYYGQVLLMR